MRARAVSLRTRDPDAISSTQAYQCILKDLEGGGGTRSHAQSRGVPRPGDVASARRATWSPAGQSVRRGATNASAKAIAMCNAARESGDGHLASGDTEHALRAYSEAIAWLPGDAASLANRAVAFQKLGDHESALRDALQAVRFNGRFVQGHVCAAQARHALGQHEQAVLSMRRAVELRPSDPGLRESLFRSIGLASKEACLLTLTGHEDAVIDFASRPHSAGRRPLLASTSFDGRVRFWCADTGIALQVLPLHDAVVTSVLWSKGGETLFTASMDRTVKVWRVAQEDPPQCIVSGTPPSPSFSPSSSLIFLHAKK